MKKIGILTFQNSNNHGALLQAFAMQETLNKLGGSPQIVNYKSSSMVSGQELSPIFEEFRSKHLKISDSVDRTQLASCDYDSWIIGSDQVWNPNITGYDDAFFLPEIESSRLVPYAASLGMQNEDISLHKDFLSAGLKHFDRISIREESNIGVLKELLGQKPPVCSHIDPTLLLDAQEYCHKLSLDNVPEIRQPFILFFSYNSDPRFIDWVNMLSCYTNIPVVAITQIPHNKFIKGTEVFDSISTVNWLSLIRDAALVVTDSYHGLMFSMIFKKAFYVYTSNSPGVTRIMDVLAKYGLSNRRISQVRMSEILFNIEYETFEAIIADERERSFSYLKNALEL